MPLLLAYLVLNRDRRVSRGELADALWPRSAPLSREAALRTLLSRLRSALPGARLVGREDLALELPEPLTVDLELAADGLAGARQALATGRVHSAWAMVREPLRIASRGLLPGARAEWLEPHRRGLEHLRATALELSGRAALALGGPRLADAQHAARALIELEPYRESAWVLLIEALAAAGNPAEGLREFERLRTLLRDELGATPGPDTVALHDRLLHGQLVGESRGGPATVRRDGGSVTRPPLPAQLATDDRPLLGREDELEALRSAWRDVAAGVAGVGAPRVLLLCGDPGIGKTRLVAETARLAHRDGAAVLAGRVPQEPLVPYQALVEALRHYVATAELEELRGAVREHGRELLALVPELARRFPDAAARLSEPGHGAADSAEAQRYRLFEAFVDVFTAISAQFPLLLVLDDLHWADRATLLLLRHLARAPQLARVLVLGAYRPSEAAGEAFGSALQALRDDQRLSALPLGGLNRLHTGELVRLITGVAPSASLLQALHARTEGNPLFVEATIRHLQSRGVAVAVAGARELSQAGLPQAVRDVLWRRLAALPQDALECLQAAAVIGRDFDVELLSRIAGQQEERLLGSLEAARAAGLLRELPGSGSSDDAHPVMGFSHVLIREVAYEATSAPRRRWLHRLLGEALGAGYGASPGRAQLGASPSGPPDIAQ